MAQNNNIGFAVAAVATGVGAKAMDLPTAFAGFLSLAVLGVCVGVTSFLKVDVTPIDLDDEQPKKKKMSKKEKRAAAAALTQAEDEAEIAKQQAKALKKREKEQARKKAKKEAEKAKKEAEELEKQKATEAAQPATEGKKKKKKKNKKKAAPKVEEVVEPVVEEEPAADEWEEVKMKKGKKKVEEVVGDEKELVSTSIYVERKHFGTIIGTQGATLKAIIEATQTKIELPKDGGIRTEILIEGLTMDACNTAKKAIKQLVAKGYSDITDPNKTDTTIAVPDNKRAVLIGPGGRNIKLIQEKTGCRINMPEKGSDDDVSIVGDSEAVKVAIKAIKQLIEQGYSDITHENYVKAEIEVHRDNLKTLIGQGGSTIRGLQDSTRVRINVPPQTSEPTVFVTLLGEPEGVADCRAQIAAMLVPPEPKPIAPEWQQEASLAHLDQW